MSCSNLAIGRKDRDFEQLKLTVSITLVAAQPHPPAQEAP